jgi:hypothetical protein
MLRGKHLVRPGERLSLRKSEPLDVVLDRRSVATPWQVYASSFAVCDAASDDPYSVFTHPPRWVSHTKIPLMSFSKAQASPRALFHRQAGSRRRGSRILWFSNPDPPTPQKTIRSRGAVDICPAHETACTNLHAGNPSDPAPNAWLHLGAASLSLGDNRHHE